MKSIGLQPTATGKEGGAEIGDVMNHMIVADGLFDRTVKKMLAKGFVLSWTEQPEQAQGSGDERDDDGAEDRPSKSGKRVKYVCPHGDMAAWSRHNAKLVCGEHMQAMLAETSPSASPTLAGRDIEPATDQEA